MDEIASSRTARERDVSCSILDYWQALARHWSPLVCEILSVLSTTFRFDYPWICFRKYDLPGAAAWSRRPSEYVCRLKQDNSAPFEEFMQGFTDTTTTRVYYIHNLYSLPINKAVLLYSENRLIGKRWDLEGQVKC